MALTKISTAMISQSAAAVDLNVDAGTFYVDTTNNRVGVGGKTDPDTALHVIGTATATLFAGSGASLTSIPNAALVNSSITINSTAVSLGGSLTLTTANIAENTNLYYTDARADARIAAADTDDLSEGSSNLYYTDARVDARVSGGSLGNITTTGYIRGPSSFTIDPAAHGDNTGTVVIAGNLQVDGTTTTINSTTMTVDDKNITLASGSANAAAADGAGFTVDIGTGTLPAITYDGTNDEWDFNKPLNVTGNIAVSGTVDGVDIAARDAVLTSTTTTAGAAFPRAGGTMTGNLAVPNLSVTSTNWLGFGDYGERISGSNGNSSLSFYTDATLALTLDSSQNATFAGTISSGAITSTGAITLNGTLGTWSVDNQGAIMNFTRATANYIKAGSAGGYLVFQTNGANAALTLNSSQNATFAGTISSGAITITADGADLIINSVDEELVLLGNRGSTGTNLDAGYLRMKAQGVNKVILDTEGVSYLNGGNVGIGTAAPASMVGGTANTAILTVGGGDGSLVTGDRVGAVSFKSDDATYKNTFADGIVGEITSIVESSSGSTYGLAFSTGNAAFADRGERMRINSSGNVGIGTTNPQAKLHVNEGPVYIGDYTGTVTPTEGIFLENAAGNSNTITMYTYGASVFKVESDGLEANIGWGSSADREVNFVNTGAGGIKVGIGTSSPTELLEVYSETASTAIEVSAGKASTTTGEAKIVLRSLHSASGTTYSRSEIASVGVAGGDSDLVFRTTSDSSGPQDRMTIDDSGRVGIGTNAPAVPLHVTKDLDGGGTILQLTNADSTYNQHLTVKFNSSKDVEFEGASGNGGIIMDPGARGTRFQISSADIGRFDSDGLRLEAGKGIKFSAHSSANILDDYEEGTWTPTITGYAQATPHSQTYSTQTGNYTKVGNLVTAHFVVTLSNKGNIASASGNYSFITGLPFTHGGSVAGTGVMWGWQALNTAVSMVAADISSTNTQAWLTHLPATSGAGTSYMGTSQITNTTSFRGTLIYKSS